MESRRSNPLFADLFNRRKDPQTNLMELLKQNILFQDLTSRELKHLSQFVFERSFQQGEPVFSQGERGMGMYLIASGRIGVFTQQKPGSGEVPIATLTAGSFFGELALVDPDHLRSAHAIAQERSMLIGFFKPDLVDIVERKPAMGSKILMRLSEVLGRRLVETTQRLTHFKTHLPRVEERDEAV